MNLRTFVLSYLRPPGLLSPQSGLLLAFLLLFLLMALPVTAKPATQGSSFTPQTVEAGISHTCAHSSEGGVKCWGRNNVGQLGDNSRQDRFQPVDTFSLTSGVAGVAAGEVFTCASLTSGAIRCWGDNTDGKLGNGSQTHSNIPVAVSNISSGATALALGTDHACAIVNGGVQCWGNNERSQLGNNSVTRSTTPLSVAALSSGVTAIGAGTQHTCALVNGKVQCWGRNDYGQVGNGNKLDQVTPVDVVDIVVTVIGLAVGDHHTCALLQGGGVKCWGRNVDGRVGNDTVIEQPRPVDVSGLTSGVSAIGAGGRHSCAVISANGAVRCWGFNGDGQLGNNSLVNSAIPVNVLTLTNVQSVTLGDNHTCAQRDDRSVFCWGDNQFGQLGNNSQSNTGIPVQVTGFNAATPMPTTPPPTTPPPTTPAPTTPPTTIARPDLTVTGMQVELETGGSCSYSSTQLGVRVTVSNIGNAAAGSFVVAVNGQSKAVSEGLAVGANTTVWLAGGTGGDTTATVDSTALVQESNENNNTLTQFLPIPTLPPTCTPTTPPPPIATTPAPMTPDPLGEKHMYLPAIARPLPTPTPTFTPIATRVWRQIAGDNNLTVAKVAVQGETLLVGARGVQSDPARGLYSGSLTACRTGVALGRVRAIPVGSVFDIIFAGTNGVTTSYDDGIFYTNDGGGTWQSGTPAVAQPRTVAIVTDVFFVGTEVSGVHLSTDGGRTWTQRRSQPAAINVVKLDVKAPDLLWIGTDQQGIYSLRIGNTDTFVQNNAGLSGDALNVWDFAFATTQIYVATEGGVFVGDGISTWTALDSPPAGVAFISLELVGSTLYAGARNNGVWRKPLAGGAWERLSAPGWNENHNVRDLLYENTHCQGLLAATEDGVWLYR